MTRAAVEQEYQRFLHELMGFMEQTVSPTRIASTIKFDVADSIVKQIARPQIHAFMTDIEGDLERNGDAVIDVATRVAEGGVASKEVDRSWERIKATNPVYNSVYDMNAARRHRLETEIKTSVRRISDLLAPLIASPEDDYWNALKKEHRPANARRLMDEQLKPLSLFRKNRKFVKITSEVTIPLGLFSRTVQIDATNEAIRVIIEGEHYMRGKLTHHLRELYGARKV